MPTLRDVAKAAGVSLTTASYVLNNKGTISDTTRQRVFQAIRELGYKRRSPAQNRIVLVGNVPQPLTAWIIHACAEYGFELAEMKLDRHGPVNAAELHAFDGAIMYGGLWAPRSFDTVAKHVPTVFLGGSYPRDGSDRVWVDNAGAVYAAMQHLFGAGHRHIGLVNGPRDTITTGEKQLGFEQALYDFPHVRGVSVSADDFYEAGGFRAFEKLHRAFPEMTAVVSAEVQTTLGILSYCTDYGLTIGRTMSLIAMRDRVEFEKAEPAISAFSIPNADIARAAIEQLVTRMNMPHLLGRRLLLLPRMIERESVARIDD